MGSARKNPLHVEEETNRTQTCNLGSCHCQTGVSSYYEGCSESLWNLVIKFSNINIILSFYEISQVDIFELASRS